MEPNLWMVCFVDENPEWSWWHFATRKGYRHCFAMGFCPETGVWTLVDWARNGFLIHSLTDAQSTAFLQVCDQRGEVWECLAAERSMRFWPSLNYCVHLIKDLLGLEGYIFTPWQLRRAMIAAGARKFDLQRVKHPFEEATT